MFGRPGIRAVAFAALLGVPVACTTAGSAPMPTGDAAGDATLVEGRTVWVARCQRCHGPAGKGGACPRLAGRVVAAYPDPAAEADVVRNGKGGGMPAWRAVLTDAEITAVVEYTRRVL